MPGEWRRGDYIISTDRARLDVDVIYASSPRLLLGAGEVAETVERSIAHSLAFGVYKAASRTGRLRPRGDGLRYLWLGGRRLLLDHTGAKDG